MAFSGLYNPDSCFPCKINLNNRVCVGCLMKGRAELEDRVYALYSEAVCGNSEALLGLKHMGLWNYAMNNQQYHRGIAQAILHFKAKNEPGWQMVEAIAIPSIQSAPPTANKALLPHPPHELRRAQMKYADETEENISDWKSVPLKPSFQKASSDDWTRNADRPLGTVRIENRSRNDQTLILLKTQLADYNHERLNFQNTANHSQSDDQRQRGEQRQFTEYRQPTDQRADRRSEQRTTQQNTRTGQSSATRWEPFPQRMNAMDQAERIFNHLGLSNAAKTHGSLAITCEMFVNRLYAFMDEVNMEKAMQDVNYYTDKPKPEDTQLTYNAFRANGMESALSLDTFTNKINTIDYERLSQFKYFGKTSHLAHLFQFISAKANPALMLYAAKCTVHLMDIYRDLKARRKANFNDPAIKAQYDELFRLMFAAMCGHAYSHSQLDKRMKMKENADHPLKTVITALGPLTNEQLQLEMLESARARGMANKATKGLATLVEKPQDAYQYWTSILRQRMETKASKITLGKRSLTSPEGSSGSPHLPPGEPLVKRMYVSTDESANEATLVDKLDDKTEGDKIPNASNADITDDETSEKDKSD
ncbi:uncharacterized protein LOC129587497 isoform X2 [Paramacrobiotus metropolitanus]|uniref:uncharacterized protein LOC129587497 isoform X2 n=1 Tax=Paramacrobiotus metropolitanus TaxID=2943436 RepID=UPI0024460784|nr:uncharacterized protein LOC129587497 isoform X2 [Paramacrobiotus metropolitanus]